MDYFKQFLSYLFGKIKAHSNLAVFISIFITSCFYIFWVKPYISVPGDTVNFTVPSFHSCNITFKRQVNVVSYSLSGVTNNPTGINIPPLVTKVDCQLESLPIINNLNLKRDSGQNIRVAIFTSESLAAEIESVSVDNIPIDLTTFRKNNLQGNAAIIWPRFIRMEIADILFIINDQASNFIMTFLTVGIIALFYYLVGMEVAANPYLFPEKYFRKYLNKTLKISKVTDPKDYQRALEEYAARWYVKTTSFRFFQTLGPAIGFIMTVSSLIASLHPALHATNDLASFINGIHVAMIATFLGLLLRILALEASRVNDVLLARAEKILGANLIES